MNKFITLLLSLLFFTSYAQDTTKAKSWKKGGMININFSQTYLNDYWLGGGQSNISGNSILNAFANYKKDSTSWDNSFDYAFGAANLSNFNDPAFSNNWRKTDDRLELNSKLGHHAVNKWYYSTLLNVRSQSFAGYKYDDTGLKTKISNLAAPAYALLAIGMDYKTDGFYCFVSPLSSKVTIVMDEDLSRMAAFGVDTGKQVRYEIGAFLKTGLKRDLVKNVSIKTDLQLFSNYLHNPQNIDVYWDMILVMKINGFLSATISSSLIYDDDIKSPIFEGPKDAAGKPGLSGYGPRIQFREVFGLGISYKL